MTVAFGGLSAHRLFAFSGVLSADPASGLQQIPPQAPNRNPFPQRIRQACARPHGVGFLAAPRHFGSSAFACNDGCVRGEMLLKIAFVLSAVWLLGPLGVYPGGDLVHVLLVIGWMSLLLAFLKARDAAVRRTVSGNPDKP